MGTFGNASCSTQIADKFGISEGAVGLFTSRVIQSLCNVSQNWICWPTGNERKLIGNQMAHEFLPKCMGFVDLMPYYIKLLAKIRTRIGRGRKDIACSSRLCVIQKNSSAICIQDTLAAFTILRFIQRLLWLLIRCNFFQKVCHNHKQR